MKVNGSMAEVSNKDREEEAKKLRDGKKNKYERKKKEGQKTAGGTIDHLYIPKSLFIDNAEKFGLKNDPILDITLGRCANNQNGNLRWHLPLGVDPPTVH